MSGSALAIVTPLDPFIEDVVDNFMSDPFFKLETDRMEVESQVSNDRDPADRREDGPACRSERFFLLQSE